MPVIVAVEPREGRKIWVRFADGVEGEHNVSDLKNFSRYAPLADRAVFDSVYINDVNGITWLDDLEIAPCPIYDDLKAKVRQLVDALNIPG